MTPERVYLQEAVERAQQTAPGWRSRWRMLVDKVHVVQTTHDQELLMETLSHAGRPMTVAFVNAHAMNLAVKDAAFFRHLMAADILLRDGVGMLILMRLLGMEPGRNMNGTDLIPLVLQRYRCKPTALFGTERNYLEKASSALMGQGRVLPFTLLDGFQPEAAYLQVASHVRSELIVLGMGMPKQESVASAIRASSKSPVVVVCGGAIIDFLGGKVRRAPGLVRAVGMEWLYRLALEPRRLFHRYVLGNPLFLLRAFILGVSDNDAP